MDIFVFRNKISSDDAWIASMASQLWGSTTIISKNHTHDILKLPVVVGVLDDKPVGFIVYAIEGDACEIVALYCAMERKGLGTALIERVKAIASESACRVFWVMTTNDNTQALRFYQKRGFVITEIRTNVMEAQRRIKPTIPLLGNDSIPIRDEIELTIKL